MRGYQKLGVAGTVVALVYLLALIVFGDRGLMELSRLKERERAMALQNETLAVENIDLYRTIDRLKRDPVFIESVARTELGMVGPADIVVLGPGRRGPRN